MSFYQLMQEYQNKFGIELVVEINSHGIGRISQSGSLSTLLYFSTLEELETWLKNKLCEDIPSLVTNWEK